MSSMLISIIIPVYNNEGCLTNTYTEIKNVLNQNKIQHELIFIDDCSTDGSFSLIKSIALKDTNVVVLKFVRNFGQHSATLAGIKQAKGDVIITIDADLQNDPLDIPRLVEKLNEGYQVVSGKRNIQNIPLMNRIRSLLINWCIYSITGMKLKDSTSTFKAYRRDFIDYALKIEYYMKFLPVYICYIGSRIVEIDVNYRKRKTGKSQYSLFKLTVMFLEWVMIFSSGIKMVILLICVGISFMALGVLLFGIYLFLFLQFPEASGRFFLMCAIFSFFGGINFIVLGILSDRVKQLQTTVNNQPLYIVDTFESVINNNKEYK